MNLSDLLSQILIVVGVLVIFVNIITEIVKSLVNFQKAEYLNYFVTILSIVLTLLVFLAYWQIKQMEITWYIFLAFIIVGFMVAYAAMFGFDKLLKYFKKG